LVGLDLFRNLFVLLLNHSVSESQIMKKSILVFLLLYLLSFYCRCQTNYSFTTINKDNGLIDNYVEQVYEDSRGFMWFATHEGLCRYDGNSFVYHEMPELKGYYKPSISRNFINSLVEDVDHNLWIGTLSGVYILNQLKGTYSFLKKPFDGKMPLEHNFIEQIVFDKSNNAWIGTRGGLTFYNPRTQKSNYFIHKDNDKSSISNNFIYSICVDYNGEIWIGTRDGGLDKVAKDQKSFIHCNSIPDLHIRSVFEDSKQNLWVLTAQSGLFCKRKNQQNFEKIKLINSQNNREFKSLFQNVNEDTYGNIWISTASDGIIIYNTKNKTCQTYNENSSFPHRICGNSVEFITHDSHGNMWLATHGGGVSMFSPTSSWYSHYCKNQNPKSLQGNIVSSFCEDKNGSIWVGTDGNGFAKCNFGDGSFDTFNKERGLASNAVLDICQINNNILAIATYSGGLSLFNTKTKTFKQYLYQTSRADGNLQNIYGLFFDVKTNLLWCNTFGDGVRIFDCNSLSFLNDKSSNLICKNLKVSTFSIKTVFDKASNVWIADGFQFYRINGNAISNYSKVDSSKGCESVFFVTDVLNDSKQNLWLTSYKGLMNYNRKSDCFRFFTKPNCNFSESRALLEDSFENIWISTINGLFRYNKSNDQAQNVSQEWGMPQMQYFRKSAYRTHDGRLFFGGLKGFVVIDEKAKHTLQQPQLYITKLFINDVEQKPTDSNAVISKDISFLTELVLSSNRNYLILEFAAMNFVENSKSRFKYMLKGFNNTWIETAKDRKAQFTNIPQGEYVFLLKTTDSFGNWIDKPVQLQITVLPPWWKTWWFRIFLVVLLILIVWKIIRIREDRIIKKNKELEELVQKRTSELKEMNEDLRQQKSTIQNQFESIQENHFVIELKNSQLQDALEMKDKLLTVIAHDFKNPLTSLQGMIKIIQGKVDQKGYTDIKKNVDSIASSSTKLMEQMLSILDWSLGNDKTIIHIPTDTNIANVVADVLTLVSESASRKSIAIKSSSKCKTTAWVDQRMITAVIRNVIINAIKYTEDNGKISVRILETETEVICEIEDTGNGMEQEYIDKIMSTTDLVAENYHTGFGLMICKAFILRNKGTLEIKSVINQGTIFRILLPKGNPIVKNDVEIKPEVVELELENANAELSMLIIDDNKDIIGYLGEEFADSYSVYGAYDGKKGLQLAHNIVPDIILCDVNMPNIDGLTFCRMIKSDTLTSHIPIILISAKTLQNDQVEGLQSGADDYITKPFDITILKQKVNSIILNRQILIKTFKSNISLPEKVELPVSYNDKIANDATALILANISNVDFSVDMLAKELHLSRSQLYRKFVSVLGQTPKEYILTLKFEKAIEMLKTKKYRVADIAYELGFTDSHYFSVCFTQRYGISPSNYFPKENNKE